MAWCEANGVDYVLRAGPEHAADGDDRRRNGAGPPGVRADRRSRRGSSPSFGYRTLTVGAGERRVVAKAEHLAKGANPRFVVTSLSAERRAARPLYEEDYCGRGEMENRIKEQQLHLFADRTSCRTMRANQIRLFFSSIAYVLLEALRRLGLAGTELAGGAVPDDPAEAVEDRCAGASDGAEGVGEPVERLSVCRRCSVGCTSGCRG